MHKIEELAVKLACSRDDRARALGKAALGHLRGEVGEDQFLKAAYAYLTALQASLALMLRHRIRRDPLPPPLR
jgi:hypothetical protein